MKKNGQWFRYDVENESEDIYEDVAKKVLKHLYEADQFWESNGG